MYGRRKRLENMLLVSRVRKDPQGQSRGKLYYLPLIGKSHILLCLLGKNVRSARIK